MWEANATCRDVGTDYKRSKPRSSPGAGLFFDVPPIQAAKTSPPNNNVTAK